MTQLSAAGPAGALTPEEAASRFIEYMGVAIEEDGLPRIAGRMWGFFVLHGGPISFAELAEQLGVSRGSISTNARLLRDRGIIERTALPGDRQDYYRLTDRPFDRMIVIYLERMRRTLAQTNELLALLPEDWRGQQERLGDMASFHERAIVALERLLESRQGGQR